MRIKTIRSKKIWDKYMTKSYPTSFYQSWNWGEFQKSLNKEVIRIALYENNTIVAAYQGIVILAKRGRYLYVRNGPVMNWTDDSLVKYVIKNLKDKASALNLWFVRISPHITDENIGSQNMLLKNAPISKMSDVDALDTWILDLDQDQNTILRNMRKGTRYQIRKAIKKGVTIIKSTNPNDLKKFYPIYLDTVKRQHWNGYTLEYIRNEFETFLQDNTVALYFAEYDNVYIAASIFIYFGNSSYYHYSGSLSKYRKIPGPYLIQWENIKESKKRGFKRYNFFGISPLNKPHHPWNGLTFFKKGFGGFAERWIPTRDLLVSPFYWLTAGFELFDKWRKGY